MNPEVNKTHFEMAWKRVKEVTGWTAYKALAEFVDSSTASIAGVKKRGKFNLEWAHKIAQSFGSYTDYIMDGAGPKRRETGSEGYKSADTTATPAEGYVYVPRYEVAASAGGGAVIHSEQIVDHLSFKAEWVHNTLGVPVNDLALINVLGDSMEPVLSDGDLILIDMGTRRVKDNAIYVLQLNGSLLVKRIQRKLDGSVMVKSDNVIYEPEMVTTEMLNSLNVIGRVVWCGRRM
jgi:phage repressor protein C with HTH and peptisase S24 domain